MIALLVKSELRPRIEEFRLPLRRRGKAAFMLAEAVIATGISLLTLGAVMMLNGQQLKLVKSTRETNAASLLLQDRVEQFRILSWKKFTDATYLRDHFIADRPKSADMLPGVSEQLKVSAWPDASVCTPILVQYTSGGSPVALLTGGSGTSSIASAGLVKVDLTTTWTGNDNRTHKRVYSSIISDSGITRVNLQAFGNTTGTTTTSTGSTASTGSTTTSTGTTTTTTSTGTATTSTGTTSTGTTSTGTTSKGTTSTGTTTTTTSPGNSNGNGNSESSKGLGNTGGKKGSG